MDPFVIKTGDKGKATDHRVGARYQQNLEWEESLMEGAVSSEEETRLEEIPERKRIYWFLGLALIVVLILLFYSASLQIVQGEELREAAEINRVRKFPITSARGVILDRHGEQLVENIPSFQVVLTPADLLHRTEEEQQVSISALARLANISEEEIYRIVDESDPRSYEPQIVLESIDRDLALILEAKRDEIIGFQAISNSRRNYFDEYYSHILGYTGKPNEKDAEEYRNDEAYSGLEVIGKDGIESVYDRRLRGIPGSKQIEVDAKGREKTLVAVREPVPGENLELSIDAGLQQKAAENMEHILRSAGLTSGSFVALDPRNGEVLSMLSYPSFSNNKFAEGISHEEYNKLANDENQPLFNRPIAGTYSSGSVIKPVIGVAALEEGIVTDKSSIMDAGVIEIPNIYDPEIIYKFYGWNREGFGPVNIYTAIAWSSNIYFYTVGGGHNDIKGLGPEKIGEYMRHFGFGEVTEIDLPGEAKGLVPGREWKREVKDEKWNLGDTYNFAIGQGDFLATPLQMASSTAAIANGGTLYKPRLAKTFIDEEKDERDDLEPEILNENFMSSDTVNIIQQAMREAVTNYKGTARSLGDLPVAVAAKTGTAQFDNNRLEHSWFIAFAPYEDPEIAIAVLVEKGGSGAEAAAIVAKDTLKWYFGGQPSKEVEEEIEKAEAKAAVKENEEVGNED